MKLILILYNYSGETYIWFTSFTSLAHSNFVNMLRFKNILDDEMVGLVGIVYDSNVVQSSN